MWTLSPLRARSEAPALPLLPPAAELLPHSGAAGTAWGHPQTLAQTMAGTSPAKRREAREQRAQPSGVSVGDLILADAVSGSRGRHEALRRGDTSVHFTPDFRWAVV